MQVRLSRYEGAITLVVTPETEIEDCALVLFLLKNSSGTGEFLNIWIEGLGGKSQIEPEPVSEILPVVMENILQRVEDTKEQDQCNTSK